MKRLFPMRPYSSLIFSQPESVPPYGYIQGGFLELEEEKGERPQRESSGSVEQVLHPAVESGADGCGSHER